MKVCNPMQSVVDNLPYRDTYTIGGGGGGGGGGIGEYQVADTGPVHGVGQFLAGMQFSTKVLKCVVIC